MVRRPQSHRRKVLLPDGAQNLSARGLGSTRRPAWASWLPARRAALAGEWRGGDLERAGIRFGLYFYASLPARLVREGRHQQYWLPGYWPSSSRASLPEPYPAITLHA